jgi:hypothetical protein
MDALALHQRQGLVAVRLGRRNARIRVHPSLHLRWLMAGMGESARSARRT